MKIWQIILITLATLLAAFLILTLIRAAFWRQKQPQPAPMPEEACDPARAARRLSEAIRIPTISYSDAGAVDWAQFERFRRFLEESYPLLHQTLTREIVGRASLLYHWKGKNSALEPIALLAHQDVVPIMEGTQDDWTHPPFDGYNDGEFIWGRGALDMKNHLICVMEAVETLLEEGFTPERDVYICLGHNEEVVASDDSGARAMAQTLQARGIHLDSVIDEGGAILPAQIKGVMDHYLAGIGVAEKGAADYEITIRAKGGHSSQPPKHTALGRLAGVIRDLEAHQFPARMLPSISNLFTILGKNMTYPARIVTCNLWLLRPLVLAIMKRIPPAASLIRTTTAVTMAQGSPAANVLPQKASAVVNFRLLPGDTREGAKKHIARVVRSKQIEITYLKGKEPSAVSPQDSRAYRAIEELCMQIDPKNVVAPYLVMGGTDSYHYECVCENIYRFAPFTVNTGLLLCTHGTDERIPVRVLKDGVVFFKRYIRKLAGD